MRNLSLAAALVALAGVATPASAADWSLCGTSSNGFLSCTSASASVSGSTLTVTVANLYPGAGDQHLVTGFGFYTSASLGTATLATAPAGWVDGLSSLANPGPEGAWSWFGGATTSSGTNGAIGWDSQSVFTFTLSQPLTEMDLAELQFAFRAQSTGPDGEGSIKCYPTDGLQSEHSCYTIPPTSTVPEPATFALMGGGLLGLAGAGAVRRRRNAPQA